MRRTLLTAMIAAAASPAAAAADTVAHRTPAIGPKIAGAETVWGEETRAGGLRLMAGSRESRPRALYRLANSGARKTSRNFFHTPWALSASPTHVAAIVHTGTITSEGSDYVGTTFTPAAVGGPLSAVVRISGRIPPRGDSACDGTRESPEAVAVDGSRIAVAEPYGECGKAAEAGRVAIHEGDAVHTVPLPSPYATTALRLAGRYLAWVEEGRRHTLVVHDLDRGAEVARVARFAIGDIALDGDGIIALTYANGPYDRRLGLLRAGTPGLRALDRRVAGRGVAIAGGRVLYEQLGRREFRSRLLLRDLDGGAVRRLATFTARRRRVGDLDLATDRAVWAARRTRSADYEAKPSGPARIASRPL